MSRPPLPTSGVRIGHLVGTRVLKCHREAARAVVVDLLAHLGPDETSVPDDAADRIAAAVLTAEDGNRGPEYVVGLRTPGDALLIFGRYRTYRAATRVLERGLPYPGRARILPVIPYPKVEA